MLAQHNLQGVTVARVVHTRALFCVCARVQGGFPEARPFCELLHSASEIACEAAPGYTGPCSQGDPSSPSCRSGLVEDVAVELVAAFESTRRARDDSCCKYALVQLHLVTYGEAPHL